MPEEFQEKRPSAFKKLLKKTWIKRPLRGRPPKPKSEKIAAISIRLHPLVLAWAKSEGKKTGVGY